MSGRAARPVRRRCAAPAPSRVQAQRPWSACHRAAGRFAAPPTDAVPAPGGQARPGRARRAAPARQPSQAPPRGSSRRVCVHSTISTLRQCRARRTMLSAGGPVAWSRTSPWTSSGVRPSLSRSSRGGRNGWPTCRMRSEAPSSSASTRATGSAAVAAVEPSRGTRTVVIPPPPATAPTARSSGASAPDVPGRV